MPKKSTPPGDDEEFEDTFISPNLSTLIGSTFLTAHYKQTRHIAISKFYQPNPNDGSWQFSLSTRLLGLSHTGIFRFKFLGTSVPGEFLFNCESHPMVAHRRMARDSDAPLLKLREMYPDVPEFKEGTVQVDPDGDYNSAFMAIASIAAVALDSMFFYRGPTANGGAIWMLVMEEVAVGSLGAELPQAIANLEPRDPTKPSYTSAVARYDEGRPLGGAARLNWFRRELVSLISSLDFFDKGVTHRKLVEGFVERNGYTISSLESDHSSPEVFEKVAVEAADGVNAVKLSFDEIGRFRSIEMTLNANAYANDEFEV
ncbi:hypothetical protein M427DRAFT_33130 [Gonapodya prolifera JEL478]|uniref:Uncharacterized protein n=1 Tax=Gonapodya prolifera (strain JEL478) TaxID=1344416 RepID=A0A139ACE4_GONPJ|nr:hypothetical protein M427DRAFT_33130 [Gonapodya prolifera JEL478]|eukprot:KXS14440.1 hypothetical protein M427DRAFT_33130 [Gonapodya prolifera JEL478]